ncbi:ABC protein: subfamily ABCG-like protein, partial [Leptotrombidium deliense]
MTELDIISCADNFIGGERRKGISGGEKKRVSLASEIIGNPSILFLDEPTSGLDSHIAEKTVTLLEKLAAGGQTVICTIHQPSSQIFNKFDEVLLVSAGKVAFMGPIKNAQVFFESNGYPVPKYFNPADVYIKALAVDSENIEKSNEKNNAICEAYKQSEFAKQIHID